MIPQSDSMPTSAGTARPRPRPAAAIIIRTKNEGRYLGWCLDQLYRQQASDFEVILVDSGSTDNTLAIARRFPVRVLTIPPERFTYGYALNVGIAATAAPIVVSLSGHSIPANEQWLGNLLRRFDDPRVAGAYSRQRCHQPCPLHERLFVAAFAGHPVCIPHLSDQLFSNAAGAVRRDLWERRPFDEALPACEDVAWRLWARDSGYNMRYAPDSVVIHSHAESLARFIHRRLVESRGLVQVYAARGQSTPEPVRRMLTWLERWNAAERRRECEPRPLRPAV
jgi:glycosyltransferase involved in cell wall biosynthesis